MRRSDRRYIVIGAGAVGGSVAGRLAQAGHDVVLVARGNHLDALERSGLRLRVPEGELECELPVVAGPEQLGFLEPRDVLLLAVKSQDVEGALPGWAASRVVGGWTASELLPLVCLQDGVEAPRRALRHFRRVYASCVWLPAVHLEAGTVGAYGAPLSGVLRLGRYPHGTDQLAYDIAADFNAACFEVGVVSDVGRWQYAKLLTSLSDAVEAVSGSLDDPRARSLCARVLREGQAVLAAAGIDPVGEDEQSAARDGKVRVLALDGVPFPGRSSWQSLARRAGSIEVDYLNGEVALLGRQCSRPTPLNELLQQLGNRFARERLAAGSLSVDRLVRLADEAEEIECRRRRRGCEGGP
ncbi:2-dehydropantoate 2-reductase N-terminal domain-containing protein [Streptomyces sp. NPDC051014]|uniref:ketopantoate reductase family protein n=1 Tax=Streptomyces sp. NPDC051014 TaxID=3155751 RepID=UPI00340EE21C